MDPNWVIERRWKLWKEAVSLLGVVVAEWINNPTSMIYYESNTVNRAIKVIAELKEEGIVELREDGIADEED